MALSSQGCVARWRLRTTARGATRVEGNSKLDYVERHHVSHATQFHDATHSLATLLILTWKVGDVADPTAPSQAERATHPLSSASAGEASSPGFLTPGCNPMSCLHAATPCISGARRGVSCARRPAPAAHHRRRRRRRRGGKGGGGGGSGSAAQCDRLARRPRAYSARRARVERAAPGATATSAHA